MKPNNIYLPENVRRRKQRKKTKMAALNKQLLRIFPESKGWKPEKVRLPFPLTGACAVRHQNKIYLTGTSLRTNIF
jgi:hypothetical protein